MAKIFKVSGYLVDPDNFYDADSVEDILEQM